MDVRSQTTAYLAALTAEVNRFDIPVFEKIADALLSARREGRQIFIMGNGGSGSTASHFACDINKGCAVDHAKRFKVICLNDNLPSLLAYANDMGYAVVFEEQLKNFFNPGDLVIGISGSGNSENVLRAIRYAGETGGVTIGITGFSGGKLATLADMALVTGGDDMQRVEDMHMIVVHMLMQVLGRRVGEEVQ